MKIDKKALADAMNRADTAKAAFYVALGDIEMELGFDVLGPGGYFEGDGREFEPDDVPMFVEWACERVDGEMPEGEIEYIEEDNGE